MKQKLVVFVSFFFFVNQLCSQQDLEVTPALQADQIELYTCHIEKDLQKIQQKKWALILGCSSVIGYAGYQLFFAPTRPVVLQANTASPVLSQQKYRSAQIMEMLYRINQDMYRAPVPPTTWTGRLYKFSKVCIDQAGFLILAQIIAGSFVPFMKYFDLFDQKLNNFIGNYFFTADLPWFIKKRADAKHTFDDVCRYAALCDGNVQEAQQYALRSEYAHEWNVAVKNETGERENDRVYYLQSLRTSWNLMARQLEAVLGFMNYRLQNKKIAVHKERVQSMVEHIIARYQVCATQLQQAMHDTTTPLYPIVKGLRSELENELVSFVQLERNELVQ